MRVTNTPGTHREQLEARSRREVTLSIDAHIRHAHDALEAAGIVVPPSKVNRLCKFYVREVETHGVAFVAWFVSQLTEAHGAPREVLSAELYKRISYRDKTGEDAARNVDAARKAVRR